MLLFKDRCLECSGCAFYLGRGMTNPCVKLFGRAAKLGQFLAVLVLVGFLFSPKQAEAQYSGSAIDMNVIALALQGDAASIAAIQTALGSPAAPYDVYGFLNGVRAALGDPPQFDPYGVYQPAPNAVAQLTGAFGGNVANLNTVQAALGGNFFQTWPGFFDPYGFPVVGFPNVWDDLINWSIAGTGTLGYTTLVQALGGNGAAQATLNTVMYNPPAGNWANFSLQICGYFGSCANAINAINLAIGGDTTAQSDLNTFFGALITSANASGAFDGEAIAWWTSLGFAGGGTSNCLTDTDGDGIQDCIDPDIDNDGIPNAYDTDQNGDGVVDNPDTDGDGIPDIVDPTPGGGPPTGGGGGGGGGTGAGGTGGTGTGGGGSTPPTNDCDPGASAPLTGSFGTDPCALTEDTLSMVTADYWDVAGEQFADHLNELWTNEMLPSLKNMTAQWHASVIDQTRQFGSTVDAHDLSSQIMQTQMREVEAKKRVLPNERTCATMSPAAPMAVTSSISNALAKGFTNDVQTRSDAAPGTPAEQGPVVEKKDRLQTYCDTFYDPETNAGVTPCAAPVNPAPWKNGDIDIESFLLKDTVELDQPEQLAAAKAIITNLVEPSTTEKVTDDVLTTQSGQEYVLRREQIQAWRGIAANLVASMISRRTGLPLPTTVGGSTPPPGPPPPPPPPPAPGPMGASRGTFADFLRALGMREASGRIDVCNNIGYCGLYQMGRAALIEAGCISSGSGAQSGAPNHYTQPNYNWTGGASCPCGSSMQAFLQDQACQTSAVTRFHQNQWGYLGGAAQGMACTMYNGVWLTPSGLLAGAHLVGAGGVRCYLGLGGCGPPIRLCGGIPCDKSGTLVTEYIQRMGGYDTPFAGANCGPGENGSSSATGVPPPPPKPVGQTIREIRERAGVPAALISDNPSYNEIMLAMTKERFLDPDYYTRMLNDIGALKQEQASVRAYITMQLQDIYLLQEQINILMAARSSMRLTEGSQGEMTRSETTSVR